MSGFDLWAEGSGKTLELKKALVANIEAGEKTVIVDGSATGEYEALAREACEGREPPASVEVIDIGGAGAAEGAAARPAVLGEQSEGDLDLCGAMAAGDRSEADVVVIRVRQPAKGPAGANALG